MLVKEQERKKPTGRPRHPRLKGQKGAQNAIHRHGRFIRTIVSPLGRSEQSGMPKQRRKKEGKKNIARGGMSKTVEV